MREISHSEAPVFVLTIFLIAFLLIVLFIVISRFFEKKSFPVNVDMLTATHDKLSNKGKYKKAIYLCYSYLKTIEDDQFGEYCFVYNLISNDLYNIGYVLDAAYFTNVAISYTLKMGSKKNCLPQEDLKRELQVRLEKIEGKLSSEDRLELSTKLKLFDQQGVISYPNLSSL